MPQRVAMSVATRHRPAAEKVVPPWCRRQLCQVYTAYIMHTMPSRILYHHDLWNGDKGGHLPTLLPRHLQ